jgi:hypothetical protein
VIGFLRRVWESSTKNKVFLILAGLLFAGAVAGTTYAVIVRPGDLKFMKEPGVDGAPVALRWDRKDVPVSCFYLEDVPSAYLAAYERVRLALRARVAGELLGPCVPWRLLERPKRAPDGSVLILIREEEGTKHGAETKHRFDKRDGRILSAELALDRDLPGELLDRVVLHELGHVLGLDHDREASSVMFATARGRPKDLSSRDADAIRDAYIR